MKDADRLLAEEWVFKSVLVLFSGLAFDGVGVGCVLEMIIGWPSQGGLGIRVEAGTRRGKGADTL